MNRLLKETGIEVMKDKYRNFEELNKGEKGTGYQSYVLKGSTGVAIIAPHGGGIETGTSEIARGVADRDHSLYIFEGQKRDGNQGLHLTSANFDEPSGVALVKESERVVAIHGCSESREVVYLSGLDKDLKGRIRSSLIAAGFPVEEPSDPGMQGTDPDNICNRGKRSCGVQIEISEGVRRKMFQDHTRRQGRQITRPAYERFVSAVRKAIAEEEAE